MENYLLLFTDNLVSSLILPIYQGFMFYAMLHFRQYYNPILMLFFGVLGSSIGGIVNWYLGRATIFIRKLYHRLEYEYTPKIIINLLVCAVALFSWMSAFGSAIQVLSGYFKLNLSIFTLLTILSNFFYLLYLTVTVQ
ncbi:DedA family protein [Wolbachia endosymbiont of Cruorifilaria tuberocauda]|uniref:DedA family protein n=1 Tax=Wolbachia endosymbiont of Cruorifilaria tuberocauda TaxID=1812111 RepID=UPI00158EB0BC|nr:DedA family protein [Wolbachia endosymbiont of Cruorifilaria tuberocauda]QKX01932.1 DedA family protein [Wolbachia endosymbiont of Cruorifilaria tuberocauda]